MPKDQLGQMLQEFEWCETKEADKLKKIVTSIQLGDTMSYPEFLHVRRAAAPNHQGAEPSALNQHPTQARSLPRPSRTEISPHS